MANRTERVTLELVDNFTSGMAKAAAQTALLDKTLEELDKSSVGANRSTSDLGGGNGGIAKTGKSARQASGDVDKLSQKIDASGRSARNATSDLDKYSSRLGLLAQGVALLGPSLVPITAGAIPAVAGLSAGLGAAAGAFGVVMLAANGMGDALKALDAYQLEPTTQNLDKLHQAMAKLGPDGQQFVEMIDDLEPQLRALQNTARAGLLPGVEDGVGNLLGLLPQVRAFISSMSTELGSLASQGGSSLANDSDWQKFFTYLQTDGAPIMGEFAKATGNVAAGLANLMRDFAPLEMDFATGLDHAAASFRNWSDGLDQTQGFQHFIDYIRAESPQVIALLKALGEAGVGLVHAIAPWGSTILPLLTATAKIFAALADSPLGPVLYDAAAAMIVFNRSASLLSPQAALGSGLRALKSEALELKAALLGLTPAATAATGGSASSQLSTAAAGTAGSIGVSGGIGVSRGTALSSLKAAETDYAAALARSAEALAAVRVAEGQLVVARASGEAALVAETEETLALANAELTQARAATVAASATKWQAESAVASTAGQAGILSRVGAVANSSLVRNTAGIGGTLLLANGLSTKSAPAAATQNLAGGALLGASIGMGVGPEGAAIGAALGLLGGGLLTLATHLNSTSDAVKKVTTDWSGLNATLDSSGRVTTQTKQTIGQTLLNQGLLNAANKAGITDSTAINAASGNPSALSALGAASRAKQAQLQAKLTQAQSSTIWLPSGGYTNPNQDQVKKLQQQIQDQKDLQTSVAKAARSIDDEQQASQRLGSALGAAAISTKQYNQSQEQLHQTILSNFDAVTSFGQAVQAAVKQAASGAKGLNQFTAAGSANRAALSQLVQAWNAQPMSVKKNADQYAAARNKLVALASQMGATKSQIAALQRQMDQPLQVKIAIAGEGRIATLKAELAALRDKTINVKVNSTTSNLLRHGQVDGYATGGYTGPGGRLEVAGLVHRGEVVIPQPLVQRDWGMLRSRYGHLPGFADGGLVGSTTSSLSDSASQAGLSAAAVSASKSQAKASKDATDSTKKLTKAQVEAASQVRKAKADLAGLTINLKGLNGKEFKDLRTGLHGLLEETKKNNDVLRLSGASLKDLNKASKLLTKTQTTYKDQLSTAQSNQSSLESSISSGLMPDLFSGLSSKNAFSPSATTPDTINASIAAATSKAQQYGQLLTQAQAKGLSGDALNVVLSQGGFDALQMYANAPASTVAAFTSGYQGLEKVVNADAVAGGKAIYGAQIADLQKEVRSLNKNVKDVTKAIKDKTAIDDKSRQAAATKTGDHVGDKVNGVAKNGKKKVHKK